MEKFLTLKLQTDLCVIQTFGAAIPNKLRETVLNVS